MALKPLTPAQREKMENERKEREMQKMKEEAIKKTEDTMNNVMNDYKDSFFKEEELNGTSTALTGFEIELEEEKTIPEGRYNFIVKDLAMENQVSTKYGIKNRLSVEYHIFRKYEEELSFDLKQKYNISSKKDSNFYKMYEELIGRPPVGKINLRNLLGIKGQCEVKHVIMDDGSVFPKIVNLNPEVAEESSAV